MLAHQHFLPVIVGEVGGGFRDPSSIFGEDFEGFFVADVLVGV